jgi:hypothetical protein
MHIARQAKARMWLVLPAAVVATAVIGAPSFAATPAVGTSVPTSAQATPAPTSQGIIMRDGGICDPIRHMGC